MELWFSDEIASPIYGPTRLSSSHPSLRPTLAPSRFQKSRPRRLLIPPPPHLAALEFGRGVSTADLQSENHLEGSSKRPMNSSRRHDVMADRRRATREGSDRRRPRIRSAAATARDDGHEDIARRAYDIFERHGREHGRDLEDWLQAERERRELGNQPSNGGRS